MKTEKKITWIFLFQKYSNILKCFARAITYGTDLSCLGSFWLCSNQFLLNINFMSQTLMYVCSCVNCFETWCKAQSAVWLSKIRRLWNSAFFLKHKFHQITLHSSEIRGLRSMKMSRRPLFYFLAGHSNRNFLIHEKLKPPVTLFT